MNYNRTMMILLATFLLLAGPVRAAETKADAAAAAPAPADKSTIDLVNYFLKVQLADASPKLIDPFLAVKIETLPKKLQQKAMAKQIEITQVLRVHSVKKKGIFVQPVEGCTEESFIKPLSMQSSFPSPDYEVVSEDELRCVMDQTKCSEIDLGCRFSLMIFFEKKKDRVLKFNASDPLMAKVAECRNGGGTSHLFGMGYSCMH
jgi:hypothetical protein